LPIRNFGLPGGAFTIIVTDTLLDKENELRASYLPF
jgi:hypothetical protein